MGENNNTKFTVFDENNFRKLREKYTVLRDNGLKLGIDTVTLRDLLKDSPNNCTKVAGKRRPTWKKCVCSAIFLGLAVLFSVLWNPNGWNLNSLYRKFLSSRCIVDNNYFLMEIARPITDCNICKNVSGVVLLHNATKETFAPYAYAGRPILVKGATGSWKATRTFNFDFFKKLYLETGGALESVEDECQFFPFRTEFVTLRDAFSMPDDRAKGLKTEKPWYIGWSNCNPQVTEVLRKHYSRPHFLPEDSESSAIDWIFMGWAGQGASVHIDYVQRPSWQAQISGRKTWRMFPTPECEDVCRGFTIVVEKGDIVLIDTNQWYHDTFIDPGEISITIGSEYD